MSKHKKKKQNVHHLEKVAKAQHKNEYLRKIRKVLDAIGCSHVLTMMPPGELDLLYSIRCQAINVSIAAGDVMTPGKLKWIRRLISSMLKKYEVQLVRDGKSVDLDTFFTAGITLVWYGSVLEFDEYPKAGDVKEALIPYAMDKQYKNLAFIHLRQIATITSLMMCDVTKRIYWATVNLNMNSEKTNPGFHMVWHSAPAEKIYVKINNETHLAYRLGLPVYQQGPKWVSIADLDQKLPDCKHKKPVDVYIQAHALKRLAERNDCVTRETILQELLKTLENPVFRIDPQTNKILIEFKLYNVKTGYLLVSLVGDKLVIRTFLFITQTGSPEGNKMLRNARLKKDEITFLELDRLSTFMTSEIQENKHIKQYFAEAGLKSLFDLYKILKDKNITITKHANTTLIEDYLGIDLTKEFQDEDDETEENDYESLYEEDDDEATEEEAETRTEPDKKATPGAKENAQPKLSFGRRVFGGCLTFLLRTMALVMPYRERNDERFLTDAEEAEAEKADHFSAKKLSLPAKILSWILIITLIIPSYFVFVPFNIIRRLFVKDKKKRPVKIDYKQFQLGRKKKKK